MALKLFPCPPGYRVTRLRVTYVQPDTGKTILVDVSAALDLGTRTLTWTFNTLDPSTLDIPSDPLAGFLPPDDASGRGEGFIGYTVDTAAATPSGTAINAVASIVFDTNAAISTPVWTNTIDSGNPTSAVTALAANQASNAIPLSWSGQDEAGGSGIASYTIFVSTDGGPFTPFLQNTTATSAFYFSQPGHTYAFNSIATDAAGNSQISPTAPQAQTTEAAVNRTITFGGKTKAVYTDAQGHVVTISLAGPGSGTIGFNTAGSADPVSFVVTGVTAASKLTVKVAKGITTLNDIQVTGSLGSFNAPTSDFFGAFTVTGTLGKLSLHDVNIGPSTIQVSSAGPASVFTFGTLHDLSLNVAGAIKSLSANAWTNGSAASDSLAAASLASLKIKGAFDAALTLGGSLGKAAVGSLAGGAWTINGSAFSISAGSVQSAWNSTFTGSIASFTVKGSTNGSITAASIKKVKVGGDFANGFITLTGSAPRSPRSPSVATSPTRKSVPPETSVPSTSAA